MFFNSNDQRSGGQNLRNVQCVWSNSLSVRFRCVAVVLLCFLHSLRHKKYQHDCFKFVVAVYVLIIIFNGILAILVKAVYKATEIIILPPPPVYFGCLLFQYMTYRVSQKHVTF